MTESTARIAALAEFLGDDVDDITEADYGDNSFAGPGRAEYLVLTEDEADDAAVEYVKEAVWAFNAEFLEEQTDIPAEMFAALQDQCEGANDAFLKVIEGTCGLDEFTSAAVSADGRGHFLSGYDGEENEAVADDGTRLYIYRTN